MTRKEFREQAEDMILMMAEIVHENRVLRQLYKESLEENKALIAEIRNSQDASEKFNKRVLKFALESVLPDNPRSVKDIQIPPVLASD